MSKSAVLPSMRNLRQYLLVLILLVGCSPTMKAQQVIEDWGHGIQIGLPLSALVLSAAHKDKEGAVQLIKSFAVESATVVILKRAINRRRPNGGQYSFPSGHTALAFMSATYVWKRYGYKWGIPAAALASFVGYSRAGIDEPVHYYSDVLAGAAIGILGSYIFTKKREGMDIQVDGSTSHVGIRLRWNISD